MSIDSAMPSNHLILCHPHVLCPQSFPASGSFPMSWLFPSSGQSIGASVSASAAVLPIKTQCWFPFLYLVWIKFALLFLFLTVESYIMVLKSVLIYNVGIYNYAFSSEHCFLCTSQVPVWCDFVSMRLHMSSTYPSDFFSLTHCHLGTYFKISHYV